MADKNKKLLEKKKAAVMKGNTKRAARIEKKMLKDSLKGMQEAKKGKVTKMSNGGTPRRSNTQSLEQRKQDLQNKRNERRLNSMRSYQQDVIDKGRKERLNSGRSMKEGGTLGYQPTAKYGKVTKASMYMSGGELKMYKKRKK